jgi:hypothetical protein
MTLTQEIDKQIDIFSASIFKKVKGGDFSQLIDVSISMGYTDMARHNRIGVSTVKNAGVAFLKKAIGGYFAGTHKTDTAFDKWHQENCCGLQCVCAAINSRFTIGFAQKWLNIIFKYIYAYIKIYGIPNNTPTNLLLNASNLKYYFEYCHMALDTNTKTWFHQVVAPKPPLDEMVWAKIVNYTTDYYNLQVKARDKVKNKSQEIVDELQKKVIAEKLPFPDVAKGLTITGDETLFRLEFLIWAIYK